MYIEPNTTIQFMRGVPLDPSYDHTIIFNNADEQHRTLASKIIAGMTFERQYYQRVERGYLRVKVPADRLYQANYMAFRNSSYGNKWFYAFVLSVEYINNEVCEVRFEIDVLQTYMFDYTLQQCFVERQHSTTDNVGDNIVPEELESGEMMVSKYYPLKVDLTKLCIVIATRPYQFDETQFIKRGTIIEGVYSGLVLRAYKTTNDSLRYLNQFIANFDIRPDYIQNMYMCPFEILKHGFDGIASYEDIPNDGADIIFSPSGEWQYISTDSTAVPKSFKVDTSTDRFGGYRAKNNKLFTYPFNYFGVCNTNGNEANYRYEYFGADGPVFKLTGVCIPPVQVALTPMGYKGSPYDSSSLDKQYGFVGESVTLEGYPFCSWNSDTFVAWLAQNAVPAALAAAPMISGLTAIGTKVSSVAYSGKHSETLKYGLTSSGKPYIGMSMTNQAPSMSTRSIPDYKPQETAARLASSMISGGVSALIKGTISHGNNTSGSLNVANHVQTFFTYRIHCNAQMAESIDNYFTAFGYAQKKIMTPNLKARPHWTYIKTLNCNAEGNLPADDMETIKGIYNTGITVWRQMSEVGNYSLDNSPT